MSVYRRSTPVTPASSGPTAAQKNLLITAVVAAVSFAVGAAVSVPLMRSHSQVTAAGPTRTAQAAKPEVVYGTQQVAQSGADAPLIEVTPAHKLRSHSHRSERTEESSHSEHPRHHRRSQSSSKVSSGSVETTVGPEVASVVTTYETEQPPAVSASSSSGTSQHSDKKRRHSTEHHRKQRQHQEQTDHAQSAGSGVPGDVEYIAGQRVYGADDSSSKDRHSNHGRHRRHHDDSNGNSGDQGPGPDIQHPESPDDNQ